MGRSDGGPTLYAYSNRTPVTTDLTSLMLYVIFFTLFLAFLVIFPGVRKQRFTTFFTVTLTLFVGTVILVCNHACSWSVASTNIATSYRAFSKDKIFAKLQVNIGLMSVNISMNALPIHNGSENIYFNERFTWVSPDQMKQEYKAALVKGLPYPILTVAEYLSLDSEGFCWGRSYRQAGYYTNILLWTAFGAWCIMTFLLCVIPRYGAYMMSTVGGLMLSANYIYYQLLSTMNPLIVPFGDDILFSVGVGASG